MLGGVPWETVDALGKEMRRAWTSFARHGDPNLDGGARWPTSIRVDAWGAIFVLVRSARAKREFGLETELARGCFWPTTAEMGGAHRANRWEPSSGPGLPSRARRATLGA